ncbi:protein LNK1 isoform X2 [Neltuma alba]|uniref:protein LNK1 isoform X2 n=1 Tax=Neltuma alba TaxID=207710 RepID=UPI0010A2D0F4|nr:protein LNK1-like isoform X2 [Prosopis alba]XP_028800778.1 protein LNK1-like isoform X2 [Prosopis alba]
MSNFCTYELEDHVWDEYGENDDHIVPHAGDDHKEQFAIQGDSCKRPCQELYNSKSADNVSSHYSHEKEKLYLMSRKENMMEKNSWSQTPEGVLPSCNADASEEVKRLASDDIGMSDRCFKSCNMDSSGSELCADDTILGDKRVVKDDSLCQYPINHISQTDSELSFLDNDGWLDIGNFEDVDQMFRSCDSTFGLGNLNNEEEFCWFPSSHNTEGFDEALKSDFKFSCAEAGPMKVLSDYNLDSKPDVEGPPMPGSNGTASPVDRRLRCRIDVDDDAVPGSLSMLNELDMKSGNADDLEFKDKMQKRLSEASEGRIEDVCLENGDSFHHFSPPTQYEDVKQANETSSGGVNSYASILKQKRNLNSSVLTEVPLTVPDYGNGPNHTSLFPTSSGSRSDLEGNPSPLKESSYASNMASTRGHSLQDASLKTNEKGEMSYHSHDAPALSKSSKSQDIVSVAPFSSPGSTQQQLAQFENENEGHSVVRGVKVGFSKEIDSSNVQESSSMSSAMEEISLEATSFRQLQQVMDQLDIRTKMCLRDSLYRLAKSAEQRHAYPNTNGGDGDDVEACKAMVQDPSRCTGLIDMETDTNPIDRSIAHLLFHRPSDPSRLPREDTSPFKSNVMMHGSVTNPPVGTENQKEATNGVNQKPFGG